MFDKSTDVEYIFRKSILCINRGKKAIYLHVVCVNKVKFGLFKLQIVLISSAYMLCNEVN